MPKQTTPAAETDALYRIGDRVRFHDPITGYQRGHIKSIDDEANKAVIAVDGAEGCEFSAPLAQLF